MLAKQSVLILLAALGCSDSSETTTATTSLVTDTNSSTTTDQYDTATPWWDEAESDADGDGYSLSQGDCDDGLSSVNPGITEDQCDGVDNDCDGTVDQDFDADVWEPNDITANDMGQMFDGDEIIVYGYLFPDSDQDRYRVYLEDDFSSWFSIEAWLYGVPDDADYTLTLELVEDWWGDDRGTVAFSDAEGLGGFEDVDYGGDAFWDDSGYYEIIVAANEGSDCAVPYTLQILFGGI